MKYKICHWSILIICTLAMGGVIVNAAGRISAGTIGAGDVLAIITIFVVGTASDLICLFNEKNGKR